MVRSPQEILAHHLQSAAAENLDEIIADYTHDAMIITPAGVSHGRDGARAVFTKLFAELPQANWRVVSQTFEKDILLLEWAADARDNRVEDGIDTFVFRDGLIRVQTARYTLLAED